MQTHLHEAAGVWDSEAGAFINAKHQRMAEILHDYNPHFSLVWVPPKTRTTLDFKPYAIVAKQSNLAPHIIRYLSEQDMDDPVAVLAWIFEGDLNKRRPDDVRNMLEAKMAAEEAMKLKAHEASIEEELDKLEFIARTPLHTFRIGKTKYQE